MTPSDFPYRAILSALPPRVREAWGRLANDLTPEGTPLDSPLWMEMERKAYDEVMARLAGGEFDAAEVGSVILPIGADPGPAGAGELDFGGAKP